MVHKKFVPVEFWTLRVKPWFALKAVPLIVYDVFTGAGLGVTLHEPYVTPFFPPPPPLRAASESVWFDLTTERTTAAVIIMEASTSSKAAWTLIVVLAFLLAILPISDNYKVLSSF